MKKTKFIFVTGGVLSSLGKGVSSAAIGRLLVARNYKVFVQKLDPYLNVDPGTMSPYQHGEVFVTNDGGETDLDLGHYERFLGVNVTKESNYTQGQILSELIKEEREGIYNGCTIQTIPHVTNKIIEKIFNAEKNNNVDFVITEIGGTVGDIESDIFYKAIAQFDRLNPNKSYFIHVSYVPFLETSKEFKSKPTQHSITILNSFGILPNMLLLRSVKEIDETIIKKVSEMTLVRERCIITVPNVDNIYRLPLFFESHNVVKKITEYFNLEKRKPELQKWQNYVSLLNTKKDYKATVAMVGKYVEFSDAYKSIIEALKISANLNNVELIFKWIQAETLDKKNIIDKLEGIDGVMILPGFGKRGFEGMVLTAEYARKYDIPAFGICFGFQSMVIEQAKHQKINNPISSEIEKKGLIVIDIIRGKSYDDNLGGTLRLGSSTIKLVPDTLAYKLYKREEINERHRHRYEVNPNFVKKLQTKDFIFSGFDSKSNYVEICELRKHPFYLGIQAHPEFNSSPLKESPLFKGFIKAIIKKNIF